MHGETKKIVRLTLLSFVLSNTTVVSQEVITCDRANLPQDATCDVLSGLI